MIVGYLVREYDAAGVEVYRTVMYDGDWDQAIKRSLKTPMRKGAVRRTLFRPKTNETKSITRKVKQS